MNNELHGTNFPCVSAEVCVQVTRLIKSLVILGFSDLAEMERFFPPLKLTGCKVVPFFNLHNTVSVVIDCGHINAANLAN